MSRQSVLRSRRHFWHKYSQRDRAMAPAPYEIAGATVIQFTAIDDRHRHTGNCRQIVGGTVMGPAAALAICQYPGDSAFYLFGCDNDWNCLTDTWHESLQDAKLQAEWEYEGITKTWQSH